MNRKFLREVAKRAGYSVSERSSHGPNKAYDWGPKHTMLSRHFATEKAAWRDLEDHMAAKLSEAEHLIRISQGLIREAIDRPEPLPDHDSHLLCRPRERWCLHGHWTHCSRRTAA